MKRAAFAPFASTAATAVGQLAAAPAVEPERKGQEGGDEEQDDEGRKVHG